MTVLERSRIDAIVGQLPLRSLTGRLEGNLEELAYERSKRALDLFVVLLGLFVAVPLLLLAAAAIKVSSPGPIIYGHRRVGRHGRPFMCYKLRTMVVGADSGIADPLLSVSFMEAYKLRDDPRVTRVGRFLRRTSLDELPQLWNVWVGAMSLVGPRPVPESELRDMYAEHATKITSVRPGITGLWQVSGRSNVSYETRVALDTRYLAHRSLKFDLWILWRTCIVLLLMRGAV